MKAAPKRIDVESNSGRRPDMTLDRWSTKITDRRRKTLFSARKGKGDQYSILQFGNKRFIVHTDRNKQEHLERSLEVRSTGDINVKTIDGEADLESSKGSVRVGSMTGHSMAYAPRGDVIVKELLGSVSPRSGPGDVKLKRVYSGIGARKDFDIRATRGNVVIRLVTLAASTIDIDLDQTRRKWFPCRSVGDFELDRGDKGATSISDPPESP